MITGELKSKIDRIWDTMWSCGISNPLSVIEQLTYLLFIKRLDELHTLKGRQGVVILTNATRFSRVEAGRCVRSAGTRHRFPFDERPFGYRSVRQMITGESDGRAR